MFDLQGKRVTIIGAARSGIAAAKLALRLGAQVKITDAKSEAEIKKALEGLEDQNRVTLESGAHTREFILKSDFIVASPGVWKDAEPLCWARAAGIPVMGEIEFAWRFCNKPVIAVTGSNGKTTTVTLIAKVIEASGKKACLCGNVGTPFSQHVLSSEGIDYFVVEISSFQLELIETFCPHIAVILNFSQNHLDRHPDMQDYLDAKKRIFLNQTSTDYAVLNARDKFVRPIEKEVHSRVCWFNRDGDTGNPDHLAVLEIARILGIPEEISKNVFAEFPGVEHRLEKVRVLNGVRYINDSKATTDESGRWALLNVKGPIIMISGGSDKKLDYSVLRSLVAGAIKKMIVLTRSDAVRASLHQAFEGAVPLEDHTDMKEAVASARAQAVPGDAVLLCPMTASFDMFKNYEERGMVFKKIVMEL